MNENVNEGAKASARRRLIRGAFTAPTVLTLYSGGVLAAASTSCEARTDQRQIVLVTKADDTYLRYQLWALVKKDGSIDSYYVKGDDLKNKTAPGFKPAAGEWRAFDWKTKTTGAPLSSKPTQSNCELKQVNKFVVLRVNSSGAVVGVGADSAGLAVSDSCASSLVGAAILKG